MIKRYKVTVNGRSYEVSVEEIKSEAPISKSLPTFVSEENKPNKETVSKPLIEDSVPIDENAISVKAPMPGTMVSFSVSVGDTVSEGQIVAVLEAMKMENEIASPASGKVKSIHVEKGSSVAEGQVILQIS